MLGVGLEIPNFRAETPLLMSLATILTLTLVSLSGPYPPVIGSICGPATKVPAPTKFP